ncbi:MAG: F0F1 ATP synthase subunit A, partial [Parachlamydiaceae bacterium]|nr:F0F1 ATP synthase subunit A [Parachlamydiaceae bacterium]
FHGSNWAELLHDWDSIIFAVIIASLIAILFYFGTRNSRLIPTGLQNFLELIAHNLRSLVVGILGADGDKYLPFLGTLFIYILCMNLAGIIPFMKSPSSNINITAALGLCVFIYIQFLNFRNMGIGGYFYHLAGSPKNLTEWLIAPLMFPIELLIQLSRPVTLALRLFGNVLGEDILIAAFALFGIGLVASFNSPVGLPLQIPFMLLGMLTSLMQALVFTLLTTVYILLSMPHKKEDH